MSERLRRAVDPIGTESATAPEAFAGGRILLDLDMTAENAVLNDEELLAATQYSASMRIIEAFRERARSEGRDPYPPVDHAQRIDYVVLHIRFNED